MINYISLLHFSREYSREVFVPPPPPRPPRYVRARWIDGITPDVALIAPERLLLAADRNLR